jgi:type II secretory pathway pseudopilin PulG
MWDELTLSNLLNVGILAVTALVGILAWLGARKSAREAREDQARANAAADRSAEAAEEALRLQRRVVELEEQRARETATDTQRAVLDAKYVREQRMTANGKLQSEFFVNVRNKGQATARDLRVVVDGVPADEHDQVMLNRPMSECTVGAGGELRLRLTLHLGGGLSAPFDVSIDWSDESGIPGHWEGTLS